jgi:proteasome lid subunit RPN8/RPN11
MGAFQDLLQQYKLKKDAKLLEPQIFEMIKKSAKMDREYGATIQFTKEGHLKFGKQIVGERAKISSAAWNAKINKSTSGVFHTHPRSSPSPSETDLKTLNNLGPNVWFPIGGRKGNRAQVIWYGKSDNRFVMMRKKTFGRM